MRVLLVEDDAALSSFIRKGNTVPLGCCTSIIDRNLKLLFARKIVPAAFPNRA